MFFQIFFLPLCLLFPHASHFAHSGVFDGVVQWCLRLCFFFSSLFFNFRLDNFYCSVFKFVDFLANSSMLLNLLSHYDFFKLSYCIFNWRHMILIIFMSTDIHYLMSIALIVFFSSLKIFVIAGLEPSIP